MVLNRRTKIIAREVARDKDDIPTLILEDISDDPIPSRSIQREQRRGIRIISRNDPKAKKKIPPKPPKPDPNVKLEKGRPEVYTFEMSEQICTLLSGGMSLQDICKMDGMPTYTTVLVWLWRDTPENKDFTRRYNEARQKQAEFMADDIIRISDDGGGDWLIREDKDGKPVKVFCAEHVTRSRLRVDARKWVAARLYPKKYGDYTRQEVSGPDGQPIQTTNVATQILFEFKD